MSTMVSICPRKLSREAPNVDSRPSLINLTRICKRGPLLGFGRRSNEDIRSAVLYSRCQNSVGAVDSREVVFLTRIEAPVVPCEFGNVSDLDNGLTSTAGPQLQHTYDLPIAESTQQEMRPRVFPIHSKMHPTRS